MTASRFVLAAALLTTTWSLAVVPTASACTDAMPFCIRWHHAGDSYCTEYRYGLLIEGSGIFCTPVINELQICPLRPLPRCGP